MKDSLILYQRIAEQLNIKVELVEAIIRHKWFFWGKIMGSLEEGEILDHYLGKFKINKLGFYKDKKRLYENNFYDIDTIEKERRIRKIEKIDKLMKKTYPNIEEYKHYYPKQDAEV